MEEKLISRITKTFPRKRICKMCNQEFSATSPRHFYCGNDRKKTGCSYKRRKETIYNEIRKEQSKIWKKLQRKLNTPYAQRQKNISKQYHQKNKELLREKNKIWRIYHKDLILFLNKRRNHRKKFIIENFTYNEWVELKNKYNNLCTKCGISEDELKLKWVGTQFIKLTIDHIYPISQAYEDFLKTGTKRVYTINDIQPLCISCNAKKRDIK